MHETLRSWAWVALAMLSLLRAPNSMIRLLSADAGLVLLLLGYAEWAGVQPHQQQFDDKVADAA